MSPQYQVYSLPGTSKQIFTVSDGFVPASEGSLASTNQNYNLTAWMVAQSDPDHYGDLDVYETPRGTLGPANADAEISANSTVSKDISLLDQGGSTVLLGETLMVPLADSMVYLRPLYVASSSNSQPNLQYVVAVLGKNVQIDTSLSNVLGDLLNQTVSLPNGGTGVSSTGTLPAAVAGELATAQTDYQNALSALKSGNFATFGSDLQAMEQQLQAAQALLGTTPGGSSSSTGTTTTTTAPGTKATKSKSKSASTTSSTSSTSSTTSSVPTSTEPSGGATTTTSTTLVSALPATPG
jgi:hypothetical protein